MYNAERETRSRHVVLWSVFWTTAARAHLWPAGRALARGLPQHLSALTRPSTLDLWGLLSSFLTWPGRRLWCMRYLYRAVPVCHPPHWRSRPFAAFGQSEPSSGGLAAIP